MERKTLTQDDITDVVQMRTELEKYINNVLQDNDKNLALSALINATINYTLCRCDTLEEVCDYKNAFTHIFDKIIATIDRDYFDPAS